MAEEKTNELGNHFEMKKVWELLAIVVVTAIIWNLPTSSFGIDGLTVVQQPRPRLESIIYSLFCYY